MDNRQLIARRLHDIIESAGGRYLAPHEIEAILDAAAALERAEQGPSRDWAEDASQENGWYQNQCVSCGEFFMGHKRRVSCKACVAAHSPDAALTAARTERDEAREENERLKRDAGGLEITARKALAALMSDISEDCYCAGWLIGNEYRLWAAVTDPNDDRQYGMGEISDEQVAELMKLSELCGGWIRWDDKTRETFVPLAEWQAMYERHLQEPPK